jgi:uncharacterized protein (DUF305 family)
MAMTRTHWVAVAAVVLALLFAGAATVASAGSGDDTAAKTPSVESADAGFARDMSVHHQQAVEMSFIVRDRTDDEDTRRLAYDIANTQANQRGMMLGWLDMWGLPTTLADAEPMEWMAGADSGGSGHDGHDGHGTQAEGDVPMPGMATRAQLDALNRMSGKAAEAEFLRLMITHHESGVAMAEGCVELCEPGPQRDLAQGMVDAQRSEMDLMKGMLSKREG